MKRSFLLLALLLAFVACSPAGSGDTTTTAEPSTSTTVSATTTMVPPVTTTSTMDDGFPVTVTDDLGDVSVDSRPRAIISLSSVATEMLFEIGAGPQVVAVDDQSNYPADAPTTDLSGFTPNLEAILSFQPDLVVISFDPNDLVAGLNAAGVPVITYGAAFTIDDVYRQIDGLGLATGNADAADNVNERISSDLADIVANAPSGEGVTYYHEIDNTYYSVTSATFFGEIYSLFGMENIADPADEDGSAFGYPQLSSEFVVSSDPDIIFLADSLYGESPETVGSRPGWGVMTAVTQGSIVELDSDIASRWGPRIVDFARSIADALTEYDNG